jgi:ribosome-associated protein
MTLESKTYSALELARLCAQAASDKKAGDIIILNVSKLTSFTDFFVICSAPSERQVQAIIRNVQDDLRDIGVRPTSVEGLQSSNWVLIDYGNVVFHCFTDAAREYYKLEGFWTQAEIVKFE